MQQRRHIRKGLGKIRLQIYGADKKVQCLRVLAGIPQKDGATSLNFGAARFENGGFANRFDRLGVLMLHIKRLREIEPRRRRIRLQVQHPPIGGGRLVISLGQLQGGA